MEIKDVENTRDFIFYELMGETIEQMIEFAFEAYHSRDETRLGIYLRLASRSLKSAMLLYGDRLQENQAELERKNG